MDLPYQCGGDIGQAAGVNLKLLPVYNEVASLLPIMPSTPCAQIPIPPSQKLPLKQARQCSAFTWSIPLVPLPSSPQDNFLLPSKNFPRNYFSESLAASSSPS